MSRGFVFLLLTCLAALAAPIAGQEPAADAQPADAAQIEAALRITSDAAGKYEFLLGEDEAIEAELVKQPILRWSNPAVGEIHGNVFLWTAGGRPAVVGSLFQWFSPHTHMSHEFHSLAEKPLRGKYEGADKWLVTEPGVKFSPVPDAPAPAGSAAQRLIQMRRLARDFSVTKRERDGSQQELRLLTQPIHRYADTPADKALPQVLDGALFTFVQGTDPELFLLLEARESEGKVQWEFAPARMNGVGFALRHGDREIWSVEPLPWAQIYSHRLGYTSFSDKKKAAP